MKKLIIIPIVLIAVFLISCNSTNEKRVNINKYTEMTIHLTNAGDKDFKVSQEYQTKIIGLINNSSINKISSVGLLDKISRDYVLQIIISASEFYQIIPSIDDNTLFYISGGVLGDTYSYVYEFRNEELYSDIDLIIKDLGYNLNELISFELMELFEGELISIKVNGVNIIDSVDTDWLISEMRDSGSANIPENKLALDLDIELIFEDNTNAIIKVLDDKVYSIRYDEEHYVLANIDIVEWLLSLNE